MGTRFAAWLVAPDGTRLAIKPTGILIGRAPHCDVVLTEPDASRVQAIVFSGAAGPCLSVLGKGPTAVNGEPVVHERDLAGGDLIALPGLALRVLAAPEEAAPPPRSSWVLRGPSGLFGVARTPFTVGCGADADLRLEGGPAVALRFHLADRLHVEAVAAIEVDGVPCEPGAVEELRPGATVRHASGQFEVVSTNPMSLASTEPSRLSDDEPSEIRLEFLTRGGRLTVGWRGLHRAVYLPERRCDLVAALLQPPLPFAPGSFVPDDVILPRVWPGRTMTRVELNVLIHRARHDLVRAELDGAALLDRARGGSATRFRMAADARVSVD